MYKTHSEKIHVVKMIINITHLPLNIFTIKATRKVGLHEPIPSSAFRNGDGGQISCTGLH